jgi:ribonuclease G
LPWFRRKRKDDTTDEPAQGAAKLDRAQPPAEPATIEQADVVAPATGEASDGPGTDEGDSAEGAAKKRRRRGSRGGRGRKKPAAATAEATEAPGEASKPERKPQREAAERRSTRSGSGARRKQPPRRAALPAAARELLISVDVGEQRVAVIEDGKVAEVYLERPERRSIAGNIYLGIVDNVLPGMEAAFVEIGLEKNGFLYVDEIVVPELEGRRHGKKIQDLISRGEQLLVQAVKDPMKTKGARLTTEISLPGRFLVFVPNGEGLGVSRRLDDGERQRLKDVLKELDPKGGGIIVRTAAEGASAEDIERDLVFLQRLWSTIQARAKASTAPALVYQEAELPLRIVRDLFAGDFLSATIDHERTYKRIIGYLKKTSPHMIERVHRYKERTPLFEQHGVDREIDSTLSRRVDLPSGGYLVFDYAEAFTVIDVNTGRFVGSRSKSSNQRLEDTITKNNLEAVKEVVRQLRLRDIGGIIVIDFIDMANPKNRAQVEEALRTELERDRTKTYVVEISPLGLVEMTRQNVTDGPREILTRKCPVCEGDGIVVSDATVAMGVERKLRELGSSTTRVQAYRVAVHPRLLGVLAGPGGARLAAIEEAAKRRFFLVAAENGHVHADHFEVLAEGKLADLEPASDVEGSDVEVKLVELGLYDATAGVGKLGGVDVVVANAASLVGKKAKVHIGRVLDGQAFATLVTEDRAVPAAITFEGEAEKPTRAPARRKEATRPDEAADDVARDVEVPAGGAKVEDGDAEEEDASVGVDAEAAPAKKRTRRGSRGGRRRKKPAAASDGGVEAVAADENGSSGERPVPTESDAVARKQPARRTRAPRIHVPPPEASAATDGEEPVAGEADETVGAEGAGNGQAPAKRKTRRGSRGGRNRRKKSAAASIDGEDDGRVGVPEAEVAAAAGPVEPAPSAEPSTNPSAGQSTDRGYVPMSEWLDEIEP